MSPLSPARRLRTMGFAVVSASALTFGLLTPAASAAPTWVVPPTAVSTPQHGSSITITGTECTLQGASIILELFYGAHDPSWVWRDDPNNAPTGGGGSALPTQDGSWSTQASIPTGLPEGVYTMTGECTSDPSNGGNGFYYSNALITISATGEVTTTTTTAAPGTTSTSAYVTATTAHATTTAPSAAASAVKSQPSLTG